MAINELTDHAISLGREHARNILEFRERALQQRKSALQTKPNVIQFNSQVFSSDAVPMGEPFLESTTGILIAEGDSWFDYPLHDVIENHYGQPHRFLPCQQITVSGIGAHAEINASSEEPLTPGTQYLRRLI